MDKNIFFAGMLREASEKYKKKRIVSVISEGGLRGNTKYAFLYLYDYFKKNDSTVSVYYFGGEEDKTELFKCGYPAFNISDLVEWSFAASILLESKIVIKGTHFFQNENDWFWPSLTVGAVNIQLWHGIPAKIVSAGYLSRVENFLAFSGLVHEIATTNIVVCESRHCIDIYQNSFPSSKIISLGAIRNDILISNAFDSYKYIGLDRGIYDSILTNSKKILLICPTYREDSGSDFIINTLSLLIAVSDFCQSFTILLKLHPCHLVQNSEDAKTLSGYCEKLGLIFLPVSEDVQPYLKITNVLITDYSSIWSDYVLVGGKIIFFRPDLNEYKQSRDLFEIIDASSIGIICHNIQEIKFCLINYSTNDATQKSYQNKMAKLLHANYQSGNAGEKLAQLICSLM
jgi:CDP-glycerol glycerophosphotransferase (TagB/SpsB family)